MSDNQNGKVPAASRSVDQIEADIAAARERLAGTVDELHTRTAPQEIARRQVESAKEKFTEATRTESATCAPSASPRSPQRPSR